MYWGGIDGYNTTIALLVFVIPWVLVSPRIEELQMFQITFSVFD